MKFLDRHAELDRLERLAELREGGLAVVYGRRRVGKTRLLLEWNARHAGAYHVADLSAPAIQRRALAAAVGARLPGFADVEYPDWSSLLARLARDAVAKRWRGPLILDELPYLVLASPELPSVLQRWLDHEAREARLVVALCGSSQRLMQGLVLDASAPLFGRAREILELRALTPAWLAAGMGKAHARTHVDRWTAWGGIPRYWELAREIPGSTHAAVNHLVLDPMGALHQEPDRLLLEEQPSAAEVRPLLDAIGAGAQRVSEIGGRLGRPATSLSRPLDRLVGLGLVAREVPFGESERSSKKSLYHIDDPFFRLWFRIVAPRRGVLATSLASERRALLAESWPALRAKAFEALARRWGPRVKRVASGGPWQPARRWWSGNLPEWDLVADSVDPGRLLLGEVKASDAPVSATRLRRLLHDLTARPTPATVDPRRAGAAQRVLFVIDLGRGVRPPASGPLVVTAEELLAAEAG